MPNRRQRRQGRKQGKKFKAKERDYKQRTGHLYGIYQERNRLLADMGFATYAEYLQSDLWRAIRRRVFRRDRGRCRFCDQLASQVHHGTYDGPHLRGERITKLYSCCRPCHEAMELDGKGQKIPPREVMRKTRKKAKAARAQERRRETAWASAPLLETPQIATDEELRAAGEAVRALFALPA